LLRDLPIVCLLDAAFIVRVWVKAVATECGASDLASHGDRTTSEAWLIDKEP